MTNKTDTIQSDMVGFSWMGILELSEYEKNSENTDFFNNALCYDKGKATTDDILDINMDHNNEIIVRNKRVLEYQL